MSSTQGTGAGAENVHVVCRCRPFSQKEKTDGYSKCVSIDQEIGSISISSQKRDQETKTFSFDAVFDESSTQRDVYNKTASRIVDEVLNGFNGTIFCYGQTGTGKTFSMQGIKEQPELRGIIPNAFHHIFDFISQSTEKQFLVRVSFLEIYNEEIRDLLVKPNKSTKGGLELKEHPETGVYVRDLSAFVVKNVAEMDRLMDVGNKHRSTGATLMNENSSRSHSIFSITVEFSEKGPDGDDHFVVGKLNLVDLAGSERQSKTGATGDRLKEATRINLSLSALGNCISALVDGKSSHIPYRDSKLTRLLQDSLGGNAKTLMIATLSPANYNFEETLSTLRYANRAKNIKNKPKINEDPKDAMLRQMQDEINRLKKELEAKQKGEAQIITKVLKKIVTKKVQKVIPKSKSSQRKGMDPQYHEEEEEEEEEELLQEKDTLNMSLEELQKQVELEKSKLIEMHDEEAKAIAQELEKRAIELEKEKKESDALYSQLASMQGQLISGGTHIEDRIQEQELEILKAQKELQEKAEREKRLKEQLEAKQEQQLQMEENYASLQEEVDVKTRKLKKILSKIESAKTEISDIQDEFRNEREDMLDAIRDLNREIALKCTIVDNFVPTEELKKIEKRAVFDHERDEWQLLNVTGFKDHTKIKRFTATSKSKRPICLYAKQAMIQRDPSPRYRPDNILNIGLDLPERTTIADEIPDGYQENQYSETNAFDTIFGLDLIFGKKSIVTRKGSVEAIQIQKDVEHYPDSRNASKMPKARY